jgi:hypothetical protein
MDVIYQGSLQSWPPPVPRAAAEGRLFSGWLTGSPVFGMNRGSATLEAGYPTEPLQEWQPFVYAEQRRPEGSLSTPKTSVTFRGLSSAGRGATQGIRLVQQTDRSLEMRWLRDNWKQFAGQWVAIDGERLVAHAATARQLFSLIDQQEGCQRPLMVHVEPLDDLPFGGW